MNKKTILSKAVSTFVAATTILTLSTTILNSSMVNSIFENFAKVGNIQTKAAPINVANQADVTSTTLDLQTGNNSATANDEICYRANLSASVSTLASQNAGGALTYTAVTTNAGPSTATKISVKFSFDSTKIEDPTNFAINGGGNIGTTTFTDETAPTRRVEFDVTNLTFANTETLNLTFDTNILGSATGTINPLLTISPTGPDGLSAICNMQDPVPANNTDQTFSTAIVQVADLAINKTSDGTGGFFTGSNANTNVVGKLRAGADVVYTISVVNNGPSTAGSPITVTDTYNDSQIHYISSASVGWTCTNPVLGTVTCVNPTPMLNGATETIDLTFRVTNQEPPNFQD
jgi:uncharacterized repeat protein (TIGR01451 family)